MFNILVKPKSYGISFFNNKLIFRNIFWILKSRNIEYLRMLQFPLNASIYLDLVKRNLPDYSTIFSNHLAGNMTDIGMHIKA